MSEIPRTYIQDPDKAPEVAYASKTQRCQAVAARLVDQIIESNSDQDGNYGLAQGVAAASELFKVYAIYPEVFERVIPKDADIDIKGMHDKLDEIWGYGGLPVRPQEGRGNQRVSADELDVEASIREVVAEALYDAPPTEAFLRESDIEPYKFYKNPVETTVGLLSSVAWAKREAQRAEQYLARRQESRLEGGPKNPKMKSAIYLLEDIYLRLNAHTKDASFEAEVIAALDNKATTLSDLEALVDKGVKLWVGMYRDDAERAQATFDSIVSGEASQYAPTQVTV